MKPPGRGVGSAGLVLSTSFYFLLREGGLDLNRATRLRHVRRVAYRQFCRAHMNHVIKLGWLPLFQWFYIRNVAVFIDIGSWPPLNDSEYPGGAAVPQSPYFKRDL